jgi:hypothetical protein
MTWSKLLSLAQAYGWQPEGTTLSRGPVKHHELEGTPTDYKPNEWFYCKDIADTDAWELAKAIRAAAAHSGDQKTPMLIVEAEDRAYDASIGAAALQLAAYCEEGAHVRGGRFADYASSLSSAPWEVYSLLEGSRPAWAHSRSSAHELHGHLAPELSWL